MVHHSRYSPSSTKETSSWVRGGGGSGDGNSQQRETEAAVSPATRSNKDDLHEWSIYRQNLTSSIAMQALPGAMPPSPIPEEDYYGPSENDRLPYGNFEMDNRAVESVMERGRLEDQELGDKPETYLRFGLPRVVVHHHGQFTLQRPVADFTANSRHHQHLHHQHHPNQPGRQGGRRAHSELDLTSVADSQPYRTSADYSLLRNNARTRGNLMFGQRNNKLNGWHGRSMQDNLNMLTRASHSNNNVSYGNNNINNNYQHNSSCYSNSPLVGHYAESEVLRSNTNDLADRTDPSEPVHSGAFLNSNRHHAHYFSNVDLFRNVDDAYNYLRYAKAEEMAPEETTRPHLRVKNLTFEQDVRTQFDTSMLRSPTYVRRLDNICIDLYGGDTLALLYTTEFEALTLLRVLANQNPPKGRVQGSFELNGNQLKPKQFAERLTYVGQKDLHPRLTVKQHLHLTSSLIRPATDAFKTSHMINQLIQTLALTPFRHRQISELGRTEKQRVKIACQILLDTDILVCDNITKGMDLYDAAFVIDYLRDWATKLNRIVIMAVSPPTYEILAMFYKAAILASGRMVYFGRSNRMIDYFESIDYPCPMFKNPCDYYVDLVTHDHLTLEASAESTERIKRLADLWLHKAPRLPEVPIETVPPRVRRSNCCTAAFTLYRRFWLLFLNNPWQYMRELVYALIISVLLGVLYFEMTELFMASAHDRFGLFYCIFVIFLLPSLLVNIERVCSERQFLYQDTRVRLYGRTSFFIAKVLFDLPLGVFAYAIYAAPVYLLAGLQPPTETQWHFCAIFIGIVIAHNMAWRYLSWAFAYLCKAQAAALACIATVLGASALTAGFTLNLRDMWWPLKYLRYISPVQWAMQLAASNEFYGNAISRSDSIQIFPAERSVSVIGNTSELVFNCERQRVLATVIANVPIYTVSQCSRAIGRQMYRFQDYNIPELVQYDVDSHYVYAFSLFAAWIFVSLILCLCFIRCDHKPDTRKRHRE